MFKLYFWRLQRSKACLLCQSFVRGWLDRKKIGDRERERRTRMAYRIQYCWRRYQARQWRIYMHALRHMSAWKIQRVIHRLFDGEALQRIQRKQNARRRKEILEEKMRLLMVTRWAALERRKEEFMNVFARRIQKRFRKMVYH